MGSTVLVVGGGGREHALSLLYEQSPSVDKVVVGPGNDFIAFGREKEVLIDPTVSLKDPETMVAAARRHGADLVDVAQDDALAAGAVDALTSAGLLPWGPTKAAARLEWDKEWAREQMAAAGVPHPAYRGFPITEDGVAMGYALDRIRETGAPVFIKAVGLCGGKGALRARDAKEVRGALDEMLRLGKAGQRFLVEDQIGGAEGGEEFSAYAVSTGYDWTLLPVAQDHKRRDNFDKGPQTGGMGTYAPAKVGDGRKPEIFCQLTSPILRRMRDNGTPFVGVLYVGGMATGSGKERKLSVVEYNVRWGDPEAQAILPGICGDYFKEVMDAIEGEKPVMQHDRRVRVCVVGAARGYPGDVNAVKGKEIQGLERAMRMRGVHVLGAGMKVQDDRFYANGGRLFNIVAEGRDIIDARARAYEAMAGVYIDCGGVNGVHFRTDIGERDVARAYGLRGR